MSNQPLKKMYDDIIASHLADSTEIKGCTEEEIKKLEKELNIILPGLYKEFLSVFGHQAGRFFDGTDIFYDSLLELKDIANELLEEEASPFVLPDNAYVFAAHQGYQFMYFDLNDKTNDPCVYYYMEGMEASEKKWDSFSDYLRISLDQYLDL